MWNRVERTQVAAPPGRVWQVLRELHADAHVERGVEARELAWTATSDDGTELRWWFRLDPSWQGTQVEHGCRPARSTEGDGDVASRDAVRAALVRTLREVKARAEQV